MPFDNTAKNAMLDHLGTLAARMHIHSASPGAGDANVVGNEPVSWAAASGGSKSPSANVSYTGLAANEDVTFFSLWNSGDSTRYAVGSITTGDVQANAAGEYEVTTATALQITDS